MIRFLRKHQALLAAALLALCAVGYPVAGLLAAAMDWPSRWTSVPFRAGVAMLSVMLLVLLPWRDRPLTRWAWVLAGWLALYALRLSHNMLEAHSGAAHELLFFGLAVVLPMIALIKCNLDTIESRLRVPIIWLAAGIVALAIVGEYLGWFGANSFTFTGRLSTSTVNPITLGHTATTLLLALVAWQMQGESRYRWVLWTLMGLGLVGLSYAGSRGPYVALQSALGFLILAAPAGGGRFLASRVPAVVVMGLAGLLLWHSLPMNHLIAQSDLQRQERLALQENQIDQRMAEQSQGNKAVVTAESRRDFARDTQKRLAALEIDRQNRKNLSDNAAQSRRTLIETSIAALAQNPLLGVSNWVANQGQYPHNLVLEAFQNLGIVGGAVFVALLVVGSYRAWRRIRIGQYLVPMLFFQALVAGQFSGSLYAHAQLWVTLALLLGASSSLFAKNLDAS